jgi:hypothetical protein
MTPETTTGRPTERQHWYSPTGEAVYEIKGANGLYRPTTLRDARKHGFLPSVTSILAMEAKPMLVRWQIEQALMSAITLPRLPNESDDSFITRAREDSQEQARKAAAKGTHIHAVIQGAFEGRPAPPEEAVYVRAVTAVLDMRYGPQDWETEQSFSHRDLGYGGKSDLKCPVAVVDIKCKDFGEDAKVDKLAYPEHCSQLAAYRTGHKLPPHSFCTNLFVSTRIPGLVLMKEWTPEEALDGLYAFACLHRLWMVRKNYFPRGGDT